MPVVSIALATYNGERYLRELLDSLLRQTLQDFEIVITDDASTDHTATIAAEYAERDSRIRFSVNPARFGFVKNFERAIMRCDGEFVALCDQDDVWLPEKLERLSAACRETLLVASDAEVVDENLASKGYSLADIYNQKSRSYSFQSVLHDNRFTGCTMMMNGQLLNRAIPFPHNVQHDRWLALVALDAGSFRFLPEVLTLYRQHSANTIGANKLTENLWLKLSNRLTQSRDDNIRYHARRYRRFEELSQIAPARGLRRPHCRMIEQQKRFHETFFTQRLRFSAFLTAAKNLRALGRRDSVPAEIGKLLKALVGIKRPALLPTPGDYR